MLLAQLAVVFVGIAGNRGKVIEHQLAPVFDHAHVETKTIPKPTLLELTHHGDGSRDIVKNLHVDGLIGAEVLESGGKLTLRIVVYAGNGSLKSLGETPLAGRALSNDDLEVIGSNLDDELEGLGRTSHHDNPPTLSEPAPAIVVVPPPAKKPAPLSAPAIHSEAKPTASSAPQNEISFDEPETPPAPPAHPAEPPHHEAAPVETADAVSLDDVESLTGGGGTDSPSPSANAATTLHLHAGIGVGLASRSFSPGPSTVAGYSSSPVGAIHFEGGVEPTERTTLNVLAESTLAMNTPLSGGMASTSMARWEVAAGYTTHGVTPTIGLGRRTFSIDSTDPSRTPDGDYTYLILGANVSKSITKHLAVRGVLAFEPVVAGAEPTEMAFGAATRWAIDAGAALELRPLTHVFARLAVDYQRFAWSWDAAGARGAGGAVDSYPSGTVALGAEY